MRSNRNQGEATRRSLLAATATGTVAALAGCSGNGNGDGNGNGNGDGAGDGTEGEETPVRMRTSTEGTTAYAANQGIAAVINENTDELFVEAQTSPGTEANIGSLNNEESEMVYVQNWSAQQIVDEVEPFDTLEFDMAQVFHFYDLPWFFCTANDDIESLSDIDEETTVSPTPEGSGTAPALEAALDVATDGYDRISITFGEQASAMQEGRLDVAVGTYMNFDIVPGWLDEMMGTVDLRVLDAGDDVVSEWENDDRLLIQSFGGDELEGAAATPDEISCPTFAYNFVSRADLGIDTVAEFLEVMYENREELGEYHAVLAPLADEEFWVENMYDGLPFHDAAADFYEEHDLWQDEFERADVL